MPSAPRTMGRAETARNPSPPPDTVRPSHAKAQRRNCKFIRRYMEMQGARATFSSPSLKNDPHGSEHVPHPALLHRQAKQTTS